MNKISQLDKNLKVETNINEPDLIFYDSKEAPFKIYGLYNYKEKGKFKRMPESLAKETNEGVCVLNYNTAGGRVRFKTNSKYVAIKTIMDSVCYMPHMTLAGTSGFDLYINDNGKSIYYKTFMPPVGMKDGYETIIYFENNEERDIVINFPLYNDVNELFIGIQKTADLKHGNDYKYEKPILFYGSSITQGGCASRPGNSYESIISQNLDCDFINLGFSGNCKAEEVIVNYMASLDISIFVCDYDHNAPNIEYLNATHEKLYKTMRNSKKYLPIILISKPDFDNGIDSNILRRDVIKKTYMNAVNSSDTNVYYIDGQSLFNGERRDCCTVDGCHPNDLGFYRMAEVIGNTIKKLL